MDPATDTCAPRTRLPMSLILGSQPMQNKYIFDVGIHLLTYCLRLW